MDGTASLNMYELKEIPVQQVQNVSNDANNAYITRTEFDTAMSKIQAILNQKLIPETPKEIPGNIMPATPSQEESKFNF